MITERAEIIWARAEENEEEGDELEGKKKRIRGEPEEGGRRGTTMKEEKGII